MTRARRHGWTSIAVALMASGVAGAAQSPGLDWPQYFGPERNGVANFAIGDRAALAEAWRQPLATGTAGLTVAGGRLFTLGSDGDQDFLFALDAANGKEVWRSGVGPSHADAASGPASTPAAVNGVVVAIGSSCRVVGVKASDGAAIWQRSLADDYKSRFAARGGCGMSPIASGSAVIVATGAQEGPRLVALDAMTGKEIWAAKDIPMSLNGAQGLATFGNVPQVLYHHAKPPGLSGISAVRAGDGATLWQMDLKDGMSDTMPLPLPRDRVLLQTWKNSTLLDTGSAPRVVWTTTEITATGPPPVYRDGHLYGFGGNSGEFLMCVDAETARVKWSSRPYRGSVLLVGNTLVMLSESAGLLRLIAADPAAYRETARLQVLKPGARTFTPPSFAQGRVFLRNLEEVVAVAVK